jgi:hypothetical protein
MPRLTDRFEGKEYALSDDLCICGCNPPPKLIADQESKFQTILFATEESAEVSTTERKPEKAAAQPGNAAKTTPSHVASATKDDMRRPLRFVDRETGKPHANSPYRLELTNGKLAQGTTDANGCTRALTQDERVALRSWQAGPQ